MYQIDVFHKKRDTTTSSPGTRGVITRDLEHQIGENGKQRGRVLLEGGRVGDAHAMERAGKDVERRCR